MKKNLAKIVIAILLIVQFATPVLACSQPAHTQGFWKNHISQWAEGTQYNAFNYGDKVYSWENVLHTQTRGDAWYILAHQYIAFQLNIFNDAFNKDSYTQLLSEAETLLNNGPGNIPEDLRPTAIELASQLDALNNQ